MTIELIKKDNVFYLKDDYLDTINNAVNLELHNYKEILKMMKEQADIKVGFKILFKDENRIGNEHIDSSWIIEIDNIKYFTLISKYQE